MKCKSLSKFGKSPYQEMEFISCDLVKKRRGNGRKVSVYHIKIAAKTALKDKFTIKFEPFEASDGWFHGLVRRKHIKFRKKKSAEKKSEENNLDKIIKVSHLCWFLFGTH